MLDIKPVKSKNVTDLSHLTIALSYHIGRADPIGPPLLDLARNDT